MKNIHVYFPPGTQPGEAIGKNGEDYCLALSFEQEPEYGEGTDPAVISQYPLEDILDEYNCWLEKSGTCDGPDGTVLSWVMFASPDREDLDNLLELTGKHVYNAEEERNGRTVVMLRVE